MNRLKYIIILLLVACITHPAIADIVSNGGGDASSANYQMTGCLGEPMIGEAGSAFTVIESGFLVGGSPPPPPPCCSTNPHPADELGDCRIVISEAVSYATCWKTGCIWPVGPDPIPIGYVTNAGLLWKTGECYCYDGTPEPQCWYSAACSGQISMMASGSIGPIEWDFTPSTYIAESPVSVSITVTPEAGTQVYAVEDSPPAGWTVSNITEGGAWDDVNKKVKWGLFFDANVRTLTYDAIPPTGETGEKAFLGTASFDGTDQQFDRTITDAVDCPLGDLDDDCDVDLIDFSIFSSHWLEGV